MRSPSLAGFVKPVSTRAPVWAAAWAEAAPAPDITRATAIAASETCRSVIIDFLLQAAGCSRRFPPLREAKCLIRGLLTSRGPIQPATITPETLLGPVLAGVVGLALAIVLATR